MNNWQKNRNYRKREKADGTFRYTIKAEGKNVEVSEEIYKVYATSERQMEYMEFDLKRDRVLQDEKGKAIRNEDGQPVTLPEREVSLEKLLDEGWDCAAMELLPEAEVIGQIELNTLRQGLDSLDTNERKLINALFFEGMTERGYAQRIGMTQKAINKRKHKVFIKLRKQFTEE